MVDVEHALGAVFPPTSRSRSASLKSAFYCRSKRIFDLVVAVPLLIVVLIPLALVVAPLIWLDGGAVLYRQPRIGAGGRLFPCYKFRTMVRDADQELQRIFAGDPSAEREWVESQKLQNDPRVTPVGRFLRATSLDELPQLWNVLRGEMSLIGPRPILDCEIQRYGQHYRHYLAVRPGLTGYWQVFGRGANVSYRRRVAMDVWYAKNRSFLLDCLIFVRTLGVVLQANGV